MGKKVILVKVYIVYNFLFAFFFSSGNFLGRATICNPIKSVITPAQLGLFTRVDRADTDRTFPTKTLFMENNLYRNKSWRNSH